MTPRSMVKAAVVACAAALALVAPRDGVAQISHASLPRDWPGRSSVAVAPDGTVHVVYQSANYRLRHTWTSGGAWRDEAVDNGSDAGWWNAAAVDSGGRLHVAYNADRSGLGGTTVLAYAVRDGSGWTITDVAPGGFSVSIAIGADDRPRIAHVVDTAGLRYAVFDGATWSSADTGLPATSFMGSSLVLDATGHAHATFGTNSQLYYGTNASGSWEATPLGAGGAFASIALDGQGHRHVVAAFNSGVTTPSLLHLSDAGSGWTNEYVIDPNDLPAGARHVPDYVSLLADADGHLFALVSDFVSVARRHAEVTLFTFFDGIEWRGTLVDRRPAGYEVSLARGPNGSFHGTYRRSLGRERSQALYARIRLPDVTATLDAATAAPNGNGLLIRSTVRVGNGGSTASKPSRVTFYLSDDDKFDAGDQRVGPALAVGATSPGMTRTIPVSMTVAAPVAGKRLLAVIDAGRKLDDIDRPNNTASASIVQ